jgi:hypothetical protein
LIRLTIFYVIVWFSGVNWRNLYLRERRRSSRLYNFMREGRSDLAAYRSLVKELKRKIDYYKYKWLYCFLRFDLTQNLIVNFYIWSLFKLTWIIDTYMNRLFMVIFVLVIWLCDWRILYNFASEYIGNCEQLFFRLHLLL